MDSHIQWSPGVTLASIEKQVILKAYNFFHCNKTATAAALDIAVRTLDNKLEKYELEKQDEVSRHAESQRKSHEFLARQRGYVPGQDVPAPTTSTKEGNDGFPSAASGMRVESPVNVTAKPAVSVSERKEVQGVLLSDASKGGPKKARG